MQAQVPVPYKLVPWSPLLHLGPFWMMFLQVSQLAAIPNSQIQLTDCVPQGGTVSAKLKLKIWKNEFVDLKLLLPNSTEEPLSIMVKYGKIELQQASSNINPITMDRCFSDIHQHICAKNPSRGKQSVEVHVYHSRNK